MRPPRCPLAYLLLAALLLAFQLGGLLHGLAHGLAGAGGHGPEEGGAPAAPACVTCLAFAPAGAALPASSQAMALPSWGATAPPAPPAAAPASPTPRPYGARAPPFLA